jgi:cytochrome b pre-mRNA-processing protein 3
MFNWFYRNPYQSSAQRLYADAVASARTPHFYTDLAVPDTLDGRFELITLHIFVLLFRLKNEPADRPAADKLAQAIFDVMFRDIDRNLREMGVGDLAVPKRMKKMMAGFNGRVHSYTSAVAAGRDAALHDALRRNVYGTVATPQDIWVSGLARYLMQQVQAYQNMSFNEFMTGMKNEKAA